MDYNFYKVSNILSFFDENNIGIQKKFGQNFLVERNILSFFEDLFLKINHLSFDYIAEIGPGLGFLTHFLNKKNKKLILFEIDKFFVKYLSTTYPAADIYAGCITKSYFNLKDKSSLVFGNLPYYLTSTILTLLITNLDYCRGAFFVIQKEVAEKLVLNKNSLAIFLNAYGDFKILKHISRNCFYPKPQVDSSLISYFPNSKLSIKLEFEILEIICKIFFWGKRKKIHTCLKKAPIFSPLDSINFRECIKDLLQEDKKGNMFEKRADELSPDFYYNLVKKVYMHYF